MSVVESNELIRVAAVVGPLPGPTWSFTVARSAALWIPEAEDSGMTWLDWLTGIESPPTGQVFWKGIEWRDRRPDEASAERGRMGCVFAAGGVVMNLDMDENAWLPARMLGRATEAAIAIEQWGRFFGCWPLPQERSPALRDRDRRRVLWTRAFSGNPEALVLERPLRDVPAEDRTLFLAAVKQARAGGCAVVWLEETMDAETRSALEPLVCAGPESN